VVVFLIQISTNGCRDCETEVLYLCTSMESMKVSLADGVAICRCKFGTWLRITNKSLTALFCHLYNSGLWLFKDVSLTCFFFFAVVLFAITINVSFL
jgi:hypothetical protein